MLCLSGNINHNKIVNFKQCIIENCGELKERSWDVCCQDGTVDQMPEYPDDLKVELGVSNH